MPDTIVVVPCYNEANRIDPVTFREFTEKHEGVSFLFVNDGSADTTVSILEKLAVECNKCSFVSLKTNSGKAEAVRIGVLSALNKNPKYVGFWDADLSTPLPEILTFIKVLNSRPDCEMVFGSRVNLLGRNVKRSLPRHYIGRIFATLAAQVLHLPIYDSQCGAKLFRVNESCQDIFSSPFGSRWIFDVEIVARLISSRINTSNLRAHEVIFEQPLNAWYDVNGSKLRPKDIILVFRDLVQIHWRYMR